MPQLRKRKPEVSSPLEIEEKGKGQESGISENAVKKSNHKKTPASLKSKPSTKRKIMDSLLCSDEESTSNSSNISNNIPSLSKNKILKSSSKRKICDSPLSSDVDSPASNSKNKKTAVKKLSVRNDSKLANKKKSSRSIVIKEEPNDSVNVHLSNSTTSSVANEILSDNVLDVKDIKSEPSTSFTCENKQKNEDSSSSESEWEEVEDNCEPNLDDYKPDIPKEGVEITIDCPDLRIRKRKKKEFDEREWIRLHINRVRKDHQILVHKTHLLCSLAHGFYVNKILNCDTVKGLALSLIPDDMFSFTHGKKIDKIDMDGIEKVVSWFREGFMFQNEKSVFLNQFSSLVKSFETLNAMNASEFNLMFIVLARILGFKVRFCISLYPVTYKASNLLKKPNSKKKAKKSTSGDGNEEAHENTDSLKESDSKTNSKKSTCADRNQKTKDTKSKKSEKPKKKSVKKERKDTKKTVENTPRVKKESTEVKKEKLLRPRSSVRKSYKLSSDEESDDNDKDFEVNDISSDEDFKKQPNVSRKSKRDSQNKTSNRKMLSSDSDPPSPQQSTFHSGNIICWAEVFLKPEKQWVAIECSNNIINRPYEIEALAPKPVSYILAYDNDSYVKDVTRRYCSEYMTETVKLRIDPDWWEETLEPFLPPNSVQNKTEEKKLDEILVNKPLPSTIQGFKNHPLYALKRHLLKFEAIYPPDAPPVGFMRGEPVYARDCVHQLHSRETWLKEARVVRIGEQPYKIVKARPKWDKIAGVIRTDLPLEIFGHWQTEQYEPPIAVNGKVPRNEYGNVELFKPCMLPRGTVHLQLPGLNRIAKKLGIDCSPAVVGFDGHKGSVHPVFEGFVICEEFKDTIIAAWDEEQENARKREEEKREKRIYGNWR